MVPDLLMSIGKVERIGVQSHHRRVSGRGIKISNLLGDLKNLGDGERRRQILI